MVKCIWGFYFIPMNNETTSSLACFSLETAYWRTVLLVNWGVRSSKASTGSIGSHLWRRSIALTEEEKSVEKDLLQIINGYGCRKNNSCWNYKMQVLLAKRRDFSTRLKTVHEYQLNERDWFSPGWKYQNININQNPNHKLVFELVWKKKIYTSLCCS